MNITLILDIIQVILPIGITIVLTTYFNNRVIRFKEELNTIAGSILEERKNLNTLKYIDEMDDFLIHASTYTSDNKAEINKSREEFDTLKEDDPDNFNKLMEEMFRIISKLDNLAYAVNNGILSHKIVKHIQPLIEGVYEKSRVYIAYVRTNQNNRKAFIDLEQLVKNRK